MITLGQRHGRRPVPAQPQKALPRWRSAAARARRSRSASRPAGSPGRPAHPAPAASSARSPPRRSPGGGAPPAVRLRAHLFRARRSGPAPAGSLSAVQEMSTLPSPPESAPKASALAASSLIVIASVCAASGRTMSAGPSMRTREPTSACAPSNCEVTSSAMSTPLKEAIAPAGDDTRTAPPGDRRSARGMCAHPATRARCDAPWIARSQAGSACDD